TRWFSGERRDEREPERRNRPLAERQPERYRANDAVGIGLRDAVTDALGGNGGARRRRRDDGGDGPPLRGPRQQPVAPGASAARRARRPERHIETDYGRATAAQRRHDARQQRPIPGAGAEARLARRIAREHHEARRLGDGRTRAEPAVVHRPVQRRHARAAEENQQRPDQRRAYADDGPPNQGFHA